MQEQNFEHKPDQGQNSDQKYLERLEFSPELRKTWLNFFVSNFRVVILLIVLLTSAGIYSFFKLPRESNPEVKIPIAVVTAVYPGASPSDVEELVTKKIETKIAGLKGLDRITSVSANSYSAITVEFDAKEDLKESIRSLRDKVSDARSSLPDEAADPIVREISLDDEPVLSIVLTGPYDGFTMRKFGEDLKDGLEKISGVREINISGGDEAEFEVAYDPSRLLFHGISPDQVNQIIAATNLGVPAGNFEGNKFIYPIRSDSKLTTIEDISSIAVSHSEGGGIVTVRDLAKVSEKAIKKTTQSRLSIEGSKPQNAVSLSIIKRSGSSIIETVDEAKKMTEEIVKSFPPGIKHDVTFDSAKFVRKDFEQLSHDFLLTLALVFGILFAIVGLKEAFVAGLAIPLTFFLSFTALQFLGISLNFLSLFSLILALGLLVDDAIVVVSATKQYLKTGKFTPEEAVLLVLNDFKVVLTTTTLTTVWAFLPLLFSTGIMGEYLKSIPITVSITLIGSLFIALMINHPLAAVLERIRLTTRLFWVTEIFILILAAAFFTIGGLMGYIIGGLLIFGEVWAIWWYEKGGHAIIKHNEHLTNAEWESEELIKNKLRTQAAGGSVSLTSRLMHGIVHFDKFLPIYERYLKRILLTKKQRRKAYVAVSLLFILSVSLPVTGIVKSEFFPASDYDYVYIDVRMPIGQRMEVTNEVVSKIEEKLLSYPTIANFSTLIGRGSPFSQSLREQTNIASITISLKDKSERDISSQEFANQLRTEIGNVNGARITVSTPESGPPAGSAFEARIMGDDLAKLDEIAHELGDQLVTIPGVINMDISLKESAPEYTFKLDPVKLEQNFLNAAYVGSVLRMAISGTEVSTIVAEGKEIDINARFADNRIPKLDDIQNLQILNLRRQPVFLKDVAKVELKPSVDSITRIDQKRTVLLSAGAGTQTNSNLILSEFKKRVEDYNLPQGYSIVYGGQNEQNQESVTSVIRAMIIAIILIVATLIIQFNSIRKAIIVLATIPLALIGVFIGLAIFDVPLSFPGLIGILALFGIVVKNAIILVDKINLNIKTGIPFMESVIDAGKSRMEAIFITSICTIFGILPITLSNELWRALGSAVIFGLMLSSFLTLFIVPTLYVSWVGKNLKD